jgi:DNA polymerase-3 subunit epsilon
MRKFLIFDTETSGLPDFSAPADDPNQPRVAEFAGYRVTADNPDDDNVAQILDAQPFTYLVAPDGWEMQPGAIAVNGLTTDYLMLHGQPIRGLLDWYVAQILEGCIMCAFHAQHDLKMMRGELRRAGMEDLFEQTPNICLMRSAWRKEIGMVKADGSRKGFPKLSDALAHFALPAEAVPHRAQGGAFAALGVFMGLHKIGMLLDPEVHYAKNRPTPPAQGTFNEMDF